VKKVTHKPPKIDLRGKKVHVGTKKFSTIKQAVKYMREGV